MTDPEKRLKDAKARLEAASSTEFSAARAELLDAERSLAASRGEAHAVPCDGFPPWDTGAPLPHLLTGARGVALIYLVAQPNPAWDGTSITIVDVTEVETVAIIGFIRPTAARIGPPNDEAIHGHPLHGRGLRAYAAHEVIHSTWLRDLQAINAVHRSYNPARWTSRHHYLLAFHDETVECIAEGFTVDVRTTTLAQACRDTLEQLM